MQSTRLKAFQLIAPTILLSVSLSSYATAETPYRIEAILPLTGDSALGGQACLNGMNLAQRQLSADPKNQISVVGEDNGGSPAKTISAYQKLRAQGGVQVIAAWEDSAGLVLAPSTEHDRVTLVVTGSDRAIVENRKYAFLYWLMLDTEAGAIVQEARRRGYKKLARIVTQHPGMLAMKKEFDRLNDSGLPIVVDEEISPDERDFRTVLTRIKAKGDVDAIISFVWLGQIGLLAKEAKNMGLHGVMVGSDIFEDENELKLADGGMEGAWFPQIADPLPPFRKEYEAAFPGATIYSAGNCYDIVMLAAEALKQGKDLPDYLASLKNFPGALGPVSASGDHRFIFPLLIREVHDGKFRTAQ